MIHTDKGGKALVFGDLLTEKQWLPVVPSSWLSLGTRTGEDCGGGGWERGKGGLPSAAS